MKIKVNSELAPKAIGPYSQAVLANGFVFVSGQLPIDEKTGLMANDIKQQTYQSLTNIRYILKEAGLDMNDIVKTTVLLKDINDFGSMNDVYKEFFKEVPPARIAYQVVALPKGALVEIEAIAAKK